MVESAPATRAPPWPALPLLDVMARQTVAARGAIGHGVWACRRRSRPCPKPASRTAAN